jgi:hypothetical protein
VSRNLLIAAAVVALVAIVIVVGVLILLATLVHAERDPRRPRTISDATARPS